MSRRTRIELGTREDLGADCASCFGLCCVALAFARSADFPIDKAAGDPCVHLDEADACRVHAELRPQGFKGCTVFDCFGAGQKVSRHTLRGRSWREDPAVRTQMLEAFPVVRRLHELLWYLDQAITLTGDGAGARALLERFEQVRGLSDAGPDELAAIDVDAEYDRARPLLLAASELARTGRESTGHDPAGHERGRRGRLGPGSDLSGAGLAGADLSGLTLRGALLIGADLSGSRLSRCDLLGVDLRDANLAGADLGEAIYLTQMQVNSARGDAMTVLPTGFERPSHWQG